MMSHASVISLETHLRDSHGLHPLPGSSDIVGGVVSPAGQLEAQGPVRGEGCITNHLQYYTQAQ